MPSTLSTQRSACTIEEITTPARSCMPEGKAWSIIWAPIGSDDLFRGVFSVFGNHVRLGGVISSESLSHAAVAEGSATEDTRAAHKDP